MLTHDILRSRRGVRRLTSIAVAAVGIVLLGAAGSSAQADTPQGWEKAPEVSGVEYLLVLLLIPLGLAAVIAFLAFLPSLADDHGYQPGQSWRGESEWFGGPRKGVGAADDVTPEQLAASSTDTGGTSGRW